MNYKFLTKEQEKEINELLAGEHGRAIVGLVGECLIAYKESAIKGTIAGIAGVAAISLVSVICYNLRCKRLEIKKEEVDTEDINK